MVVATVFLWLFPAEFGRGGIRCRGPGGAPQRSATNDLEVGEDGATLARPERTGSADVDLSVLCSCVPKISEIHLA